MGKMSKQFDAGGSGHARDVVRYEEGDRDWREHLDPTPVEIPSRLKLPQRQVDRVRELVRREMSQAAASQGMESFEEADDFSLDDEEWQSPYEEVFEPPVPAEQVEPKAAPGSAPGGVDKGEKAAENSVDAQGVAEAKA